MNTFLASGFKELPPNGAMLLYLSADGSLGNAKHTDDGKFYFKFKGGEGAGANIYRATLVVNAETFYMSYSKCWLFWVLGYIYGKCIYI